MASLTYPELALLERFKLFTKVKQQASKAMLKRASEAEKEAKRKAEDNDVEVRKQKLKLAMEESQKKKAEKEKEYKTIQESLKAKNRPRSLSTTQRNGLEDTAVKDVSELPGRPQDHASAPNQQQPNFRRGPPDRPIEYYMHTIFVGDLPENCDQNELGEVFAQYGNIVEFKVIQSKRFAFISYDTMPAVDHAIKATAGMMFNGGRLRVSHAKVPPHMRGQEAAYLAAIQNQRHGVPQGQHHAMPPHHDHQPAMHEQQPAGAHEDVRAPAGDGEDEDEALAPHHQAHGMWVDQDAADAPANGAIYRRLADGGLIRRLVKFITKG